MCGSKAHTLSPHTTSCSPPMHTHNKRAPQEVTYVQPRCGSLSAALWHTHASGGKQLHQTWTDASRVTSGDVKTDLHCCSLTVSFVSTIATSYAPFTLLKLSLSLFQKAFDIPLFNLMFVVFLLFSVTKFGEKALLDSFGWSTQPHTWHTGSYPTNCCYPEHLAQSRDCAG